MCSMLSEQHLPPETTQSSTWSLKLWGTTDISGKPQIAPRVGDEPTFHVVMAQLMGKPAHLLSPFDGLRGWHALIGVGRGGTLRLRVFLPLLGWIQVLRVTLLLLFLHFSKENKHLTQHLSLPRRRLLLSCRHYHFASQPQGA